MVGSTQSISDPNVVLNTIVADVLADLADELEKTDNVELFLHDWIKTTVSEHKRVIFNGNGYSEDWVKMAEQRGLPNLRSMVDAIPAFGTEKAVKMFERHGVYTKTELESRQEIMYEQYAKTINIEALAMIDIAKKQIVPAVIKYQGELADSINTIRTAADVDTSVQATLLGEVAENLKALYSAIGQLEKVTAEAEAKEEGAEQARFYHDVVFEAMGEVRKPADALEMLVAKEDWPFPSYGDLIFEV